MTQKKWTLLDTQKNLYLEDIDLSELYRDSSEETSDSASRLTNYRIRKKRLSGGFQDGVDVIEIDNGVIQITICPTRGMGILRIRKGDLDIKWDAPAKGPIHPKFVPLNEASGLGWLDGFSEWLVRCGLESNGSPDFNENGTLKSGLHGRIANTPARKVELIIDEKTGQIILEGIVEESRLFFKRLELKTIYTIQIGESGFSLRDTVTNLSAQPGEFQFLYHINTGQPLASPGAKVLIPYKTLAPRNADSAAELETWNHCDLERPGSPEVVYFVEPAKDADGKSEAMLVSQDGKNAFVLRFWDQQLPYFCLWKSRLGTHDGYVIGFEPCVNFPNAKSFERTQGRVIPLSPKESRSFDLRFDFLCDRNAIQEKEKQLTQLQNQIGGTVEKKPVFKWSGE